MRTAHRSKQSLLAAVFLLVAGAAISVATAPLVAQVRVSVDLSKPIRTMRGGIGASWHAIAKPIVDRYDPRFGLALHGGSGWGGNPPVSNTTAWREMEWHARWLGLDFVRVELEQRMYEPERNRFDFDNPEMQALYRILDWCQANGADVFLQQMWSNVAWNTWEPWKDDPRARVHSGPRSIPDFAEGLATCVEYLVKKKGYTCIRWLSITNEPGGFWGWWQRPSDKPLPPGKKVDDRKSIPMDLVAGWKAVRRALDRRGIDVPLCGPQHVPPPELEPDKINYDSLLGAYDLHSYYAQYDWMPKHNYFYPLTQLEKRLGDWTRWAHAHGKPFFLTELGCKVLGETNPKGENRTTAAMISFPAALHNAEIVVRGLNLGIDGFNRWSFTNRGDLDGQWQMVRTYDPKTGRYVRHVEPQPNAYFVYGLLSRFTAKHSTILSTRVEGGADQKCQRVFAAAVRSPRGALTIAVVNDLDKAWDVAIDLENLKAPARLYRYAVANADRDQPKLQIKSDRQFTPRPDKAEWTDRVAPLSLTIYTNYDLGPSDPGITVDRPRSRRTAVHVPRQMRTFLTLAYPGPPPEHVNLARYREIADAGFDVVAPANGAWDRSSNLKALNLAAKVGLRVLVTDARVLPWHIEDRVKIPQRNIEAVAADYRGHPALFAYFICDEPNARYFPELASTSRRLRLADPEHPALVNLFPGYASGAQLGFDRFGDYVDAFVKTVKPVVLSYDHYPLRVPQAGTTDWFGDLAVMRRESLGAGIPFWICLQSEGLKGALRVPTRPEIYWQAATALAYGVRGVVWFTYWTPSPTQGIPLNESGEAYLPETHIGGMLSIDGKRTLRYEYVRAANRFLHQAGRALTGWVSTDVTHWQDGKLLHGYKLPNRARKDPACFELRGDTANVVVGTFARGNQRCLVVANRAFAQPTTVTLKPRGDWRFSRVVATLAAEKTATSEHPTTWKLAPGGCVVLQYAQDQHAVTRQSGAFRQYDVPLPPFGSAGGAAGRFRGHDMAFATARRRAARCALK